MQKRWISGCVCGVLSAWFVSSAWATDWLPVEGAPGVSPAIQALEDADRYAEPGGMVRVATYNIQDFFEGADDSRRTWEHAERQARVAGRIVDEINPDVLILQEFESPEMMRLFNKILERPFAVGYITSFGSGVGRHNKLNLAVLSRFPLKDVTDVDFTTLKGPGRPTRGVMRFEVDLDDDTTLLVYNVHLKANWGDQRRNISQRRNALTWVMEDVASKRDASDDEASLQVMVGGDFNVDPEHASFAGDPSLDLLKGLVDLWAGRPLEERITVPTRHGVPDLEFPPVAFDRFYVNAGLTDGGWVAGQPDVLSKGVHLEDVRVIAGEDDVTASDHYPVYFDLYRSRN